MNIRINSISPRAVQMLAFGVLALCGACAGPNVALEQARKGYEEARQDPEIVRQAPHILHEAEQALREAEQADDQEEVDHLAYMAKRGVDIARAEAQRKTAEAEAERALEGRDKVVLEARTREADEAIARARQLAQDLAAQHTDRGLVLTLGDVLFDYNRASLKPGAQQHLYRLVTFLQEHPEQTVMIEGHTDSRGSESYNLDLSERRARAVQDFLTSNGISPERIVSRGLGEAYPLASNDTVAGRQQNRRIEIVLPGAGQTGVEPPPEPGIAVQ